MQGMFSCAPGILKLKLSGRKITPIKRAVLLLLHPKQEEKPCVSKKTEL